MVAKLRQLTDEFERAFIQQLQVRDRSRRLQMQCSRDSASTPDVYILLVCM